MKITFKSIVEIYVTIMMVISLVIMADRLTEKTSRPIVIGDQINPIVIVIKKGCIFQQRIEQL